MSQCLVRHVRLALTAATIGFTTTAAMAQDELSTLDLYDMFQVSTRAGWQDNSLEEPDPDSSDNGPTGFLNDLLFVYRDWEFAELDIESIDDDIIDEVTVLDTPREELALRWRGGGETSGFVLELFSETFGENDTFDLYGLRLGVDGAARFVRDQAISPLIDYGLLIGIHAGDGDANLNGDDETVIYADADINLGIGIDVYGFQAAVGGQVNGLVGIIENDANPDADDEDLDDDFSVTGANVAGYVRAGYRARNAPVFFDIRGLFGDITGLTLKVGFRF